MISFVGAGPGDLELLTVKGKRRLQEADAVIYDRLVNPLLLFYCKVDCDFIYVGKTPYQKSMKQEMINQLLIDTDKKYAQVVRLKGGDPGIFGRLTEELETVTSEGISFEIIPGITAASGTAAYNGISLTERARARAVTFMTGHVKENELAAFPVLTKEQTLCVYMGVEALPSFITHLSSNGFSPRTEIAVISWGTYGRQKKVTGTLSTILPMIVEAGLKNPAMILIGEVVSSEQKFNWFEKLPNYGLRCLLVSTRSPTIDELIQYTSAGADVWWHQVGEKRDLRFDSISDRYLAEQTFEQIIFMEQAAEGVFLNKQRGE